ncbi:MAG: motif [Armatimonadetes bacterium]|nr:motif [Armatimonadota bacterium]
MVSACIGFAFAPHAAHAAVTFHVGPGAVQPDENVLYNRSELQHNGFHVQGHTNQTDTLVGIDGNVRLFANGGQSRIDTETANDDLRQLRFYFENPQVTFKEIEFNLNAAADGAVTLIARGGFGTRTQEFAVDKSGQNFFSLDASGADYFTSVEFVTNVRVQDLKQLRIGGLGELEDDNPVGSTGDLAPEGGSGMMLAGGMLPMGLMLLRRGRFRLLR